MPIYQHDPEQLSARRRPAKEASAEATTPQHPALRQQRILGNGRVARIHLQRQAEEEEEEELLQASRDPALQRQAEEEEEEELLQASRDPALQRDDAPEVGRAGGPLSEATSARIASRRGAGAALDAATRSTMEQNFEADFADVRLHTDGEAALLNRRVAAQAFTTGNDIFFGAGTSPGNHELLAHELTHVVQQRSMGSSSGPLSVGPASDAYEQAAEAMAHMVSHRSLSDEKVEEE